MRIWASGWTNCASPRRPSGPIRRSSKSCPPSRKATSFWRRFASGRIVGPRLSSNGVKSARIRALEPTGLLGLAAALIHERRLAEAGEVVTQLKQKTWPARFENGPLNVRGKIGELEQKLHERK